VWTYRTLQRTEQVRVEVFGPADTTLRRLLEAEIVRLSALLGRILTLSLGPADIAAHL